MSSFIFALNAVLPIVIMVAIGYFIRRIGLVGENFAKTANKLVFRIFLPVMLFLNVYKIESIKNIEYSFMLYAAGAIIVLFLAFIPVVMAVTKKNDRRGPLLQACIRSNYALIGIPLVESLFGEGALAGATLLSAVSIPLFNITAVIALTVFSKSGKKPGVGSVLKGIVKNPLIQGIFAGVAVLVLRELFVNFDITFRLSQIKPVYTVLGYLSNLATPLALLMLGVQFDFSAIKDMKKEIIFGSLARVLIVPVLGLGTAYLFRNSFTGAHFASFIALFATPVAVSTVPMAQEMDADVPLAAQLVVWTTPFSAVTIFAASFIFKAIGIF